jgi:hypothetical protein
MNNDVPHYLLDATVFCFRREEAFALAQAKAFEEEGGFTERLYRVRSEKRAAQSASTRSTKSTP